MKKNYSKPIVEKIEFNYQAIVATSGCGGYAETNTVETTSGCSAGQPAVHATPTT